MTYKVLKVGLLLIGLCGTSAFATGEDCCQFPPGSNPECTSDITPANCGQAGGTPLTDHICPPGGGQCITKGAIPTTSQWGLIAMALLVLTAGAVVVGRRCRAAAS